MSAEPTDAEVEAAFRDVGGLRGWSDDEVREYLGHALTAALPLIRERIAVDIRAEYDKVAADEGATLESDRVIDGICNGLLRAIRIARAA